MTKPVSTFAFPKEEKITSRKEIESIFEESKSFHSFPIKVLYIRRMDDSQDAVPLRVLISVPKRRLKRSVDRNLVKRRMRESYRLNKSGLMEICTNSGNKLSVGFIYTANEVLEYKRINDKIILSLQRLVHELS